MKRTNLRSQNVTKRNRQVKTYGTQTPLSSAAVERGSTRWLAGSNVQIDGILAVAGTFNVSGTTTISGALTIAGPTGITGNLTIQGVTDITGKLNVTGPTTLDGVLDIGGDTTITGTLSIEGDSTISGKLDVTGAMSTKGTLSVEGVTTLKNDLNVESGGRIFAGDLMIEPAVGGQINFAGGSIAAGQFGMLMNHNIGVTLQAPEIDLTATKTRVNGNLEVSGATTLAGRLAANEQVYIPNISNASSSSFTPNVYIDSNGKLWRTPWTPA